MSHVYKLSERGLIKPPKCVQESIQYECIMGSNAYGVSADNSDMDIYGFCMPEIEVLMPHLSGWVNGFGPVPKEFGQYQQHHIKTDIWKKEQEYDVCIYNITKYLWLCGNGNPNMIDSMFVHDTCVTHLTEIGSYLRDNRHHFLSKKCWHTFKGYAYSQMHKLKFKKNTTGKRKALIEKYGYDIKFAYHIVRLLNEVEQIMVEHDIDLMVNRKQLISIRQGEWKEQEIYDYFVDKEKQLEEVYLTSSLRMKPDWKSISENLNVMISMYYDIGEIKDRSILTKQFRSDIKESIDKVFDRYEYNINKVKGK